MQVEKDIRGISFTKLELSRLYLTYHIVKINIVNF